MTHRKLHIALWGMVFPARLSAAPFLHAPEKEDFDAYKLRIDAGRYYSNPTGSIHGASDTGSIDLTKDLGFSSYPTFSGKVDWKSQGRTIFTSPSFHSIPRARRCSTGRLPFRGRRSLLD